MPKGKGHREPAIGTPQEHIGLRVPKSFTDQLAKLRKDQELEALGESVFYRMVMSCGIKNFSLADSTLDAPASNKARKTGAKKVDAVVR